MLTSLALIFLVGLAAASICQRLKLPRIVGMLITGIVLGPYALDSFDPTILLISGELRKMALIIIFLKAGLASLIRYPMQSNLLPLIICCQHVIEGHDCHIFADVFCGNRVLIAGV